MKSILKIGYHRFLLPDTASASKVLEILAKGVRIEGDHTYKGEIELSAEDDRIDLEMKVVPPGTRFVKKGGEAIGDDTVWVKKKPKRLKGQPTLWLQG